MSREAHEEAVAVFLAEISALQHRLLAAQEKQADALGAGVLAFGDPPATESARNALEWTITMHEGIAGLLGICEHIKAEAGRYQGGF